MSETAYDITTARKNPYAPTLVGVNVKVPLVVPFSISINFPPSK